MCFLLKKGCQQNLKKNIKMKKILTFFTATFLTILAFGQVDTLKQSKELVVSLKVLNKTQVNITVKNISKKIINAYSYVKAENNQYDYFEIEALTPDHEQMVFVFYSDREKSVPVIVELKPDESFSHTIDLLQWSEQSINKETLSRSGFHYLHNGIKIRAKYRNSPCENCNEYYKSIWTGYVYSDWVDF